MTEDTSKHQVAGMTVAMNVGVVRRLVRPVRICLNASRAKKDTGVHPVIITVPVAAAIVVQSLAV